MGLLLLPAAAHAQEAAAPANGGPVPSQEQQIEENPFADLEEAPIPEAAPVLITTTKPKSNKPELYGGIFYGHIGFVSTDPKRVGVIIYPLNDNEGRHQFVVDKKTEFRIDGKKAKFEDLQVGQKVALRYFSENRMAIAEIVFVEHGDFNPAQYILKTKKRAAPAKE